MQQKKGNVWRLIQPGDALCITTNGFVKANGEAVMGRGIAKQAKDRMPLTIALRLGRLISTYGNHVRLLERYYGVDIFSFPVKHRWDEEADLELIRRSAAELSVMTMRSSYQRIWLPRPGCGNGRLRWGEVRPVIEPILLDSRFIVVSMGRG